MTQISLEQPGTGKRVDLTPQWVQAFLDELARTSRHQSKTTLTALIGTDAVVTVRTGSRTRVYNVRGRAGLEDVRTGRMRTFYMGLLLLEMLR